MRKVLFVCTANLQRSPTAEKLFQGWKDTWESKSAGIMPDSEVTPLSQVLIDWADLVIVMEPIHSQYIHANFQCNPNKIYVLNIADRYFREDPELIRELRRKVTPLLE
ncbi:MAG: phosphotyrosine protein phosphatase [Candidatus Bathyarchaeia archaeon]